MTYNNEHQRLDLRQPNEVMSLTRLGSLHATRLSFSRTILRHAADKNWQIKLSTFTLNDMGVGHAVYTIVTEENKYSCLIFAHQISDDKRSDRVIANEWDITFGLVEGDLSNEDIHRLSQSVPLQEAGRNNANVLVLSRANKSLRNFNYFVDCLADQQQPDVQKIVDVGYLYRTTAVYGNGKFGIADYHRLKEKWDFYRPFSAQMFAVYLLRDFCIKQVEHVAKCKNPYAHKLNPEISRFIGIGNSTGLGMAPFLVNHPGLISQWVYVLEMAIMRCQNETLTSEALAQYKQILAKAYSHFQQTSAIDECQNRRYRTLETDIENAIKLLKHQNQNDQTFNSWQQIISMIGKGKQWESKELFNSILLELYPQHSDDLCDQLANEENYDLDGGMYLKDLLEITSERYRWTGQFNFKDESQYYWFWYRSEEKEEPRLGIRGVENGEQKEMHLGIAKRVQMLKNKGIEFVERFPNAYVADFLLVHPDMRGIARRVQSMAKYIYPEIHANLYAKDIRPLDLLRFKLAFFGASKFDPKSDKWVRITLFQGAPSLAELIHDFKDDWYFPVAPAVSSSDCQTSGCNYESIL